MIELPQRGVEEEFEAFGKALVEGFESESWKEIMKRSGPRATMLDLAIIEGGLKSSKEGIRVDLKDLVGEDWFRI